MESVLFDSNIHKWNKNDSEFSSKLNNKLKVMILIENNFGNIFGGYIEKEIKINQFINEGTYVFSMKKNDTIEMKKYPLKPNEKGFYLCRDYYNVLFAFGEENDYFRDICIWKKDVKQNEYCKQHSFEYDGKEHCLSDKIDFEVERILVYQLK